MMCEIIPTILVQDRLEFVRRLGIMQGKIPMAQMDIMDGKFVANTTFADPEIAAHYKVAYELDLMVGDPEPVLDMWKGVAQVTRAFVHVEIKKPLGPLLKKIRSYGWEAGVALNPDTAWEKVKSYLVAESGSRRLQPAHHKERRLKTGGYNNSMADTILFMTVYPGQNAAPFQPQVIPKIEQFHSAHPEVPIEVDGGVNSETLPRLLEAGVTRFAVGSAIWSAPDPLIAYKNLLKQITH